MKLINIILILLIIYVLYVITKSSYTSYSTNTHATYIPYSHASPGTSSRDIINDVVRLDKKVSKPTPIVREMINPNFLNIQWHNDYRDLYTALNNLVPDKQQLFNVANIPIQYSEPDPSEVKYMIDDFLTVLNINIKTQVPTKRHCNTGWDEAIPDPNIKSGWEKLQESLGLPTSLYEKPASKGGVKLIAINLVQKYETEDEIKYSCDIVIQKENVDDQMVIKTHFVQDKRPLVDEQDFFKPKNIEMKVVIEGIDIVGFLSKYGDDAKKQFDQDKEKYMDYDRLEYNQMTDPKYIRDVLMTKYEQKNQEMEQRNAMLDEEGQDFHRTLPSIYAYNNILGTKTLFPKKPY